ncbi:hypothetical protein DFJ74DRAFT_740827 [Hyaloraphidium curvatum]|nr:hypothetical protein DFJ74DRAFT_740827 [Hyaloraphidium curvatum]
MRRVGRAPRDLARLRQAVLVRLGDHVVPVRAPGQHLARIRRRDGVRVLVGARVVRARHRLPLADVIPRFGLVARPPQAHRPDAADNGPRRERVVHGRDGRAAHRQPQLARLGAARAAVAGLGAAVRRVRGERREVAGHDAVVRARRDGAEHDAGRVDRGGRPRHVVGQAEGRVGGALDRRGRRGENVLRVRGGGHRGEDGGGEGEESGGEAGHVSVSLVQVGYGNRVWFAVDRL